MDDETRTDSDLRPAADDDLAPLLHLAGRRPRLPEAEVAPIREAAREVFRRQARRTARRRRLAWTAAAGLAAALLFVVGSLVRSPGGPQQPVATLALRSGEVSAPDRLAAGTVITTGDSGLAAVRLPAGESLRIDSRSTVRMDSANRVTLQRGAVYFDSGGTAAPAERIEVATALGTVRDIGTQFEVRLLADALRVRVREGEVLVDDEGTIHPARAGGEIVLRPRGRLRRAGIAAYGPAWQWVQRAAPPLAIEGASLADFLAWVSRETGLRWRLAEPPAGRPPAEIILHGSIAGLTAEEALAVVLPGCGYRHRRHGDQLWLERAAAQP